MALQIETIRATADRVAASHHLDLVDIEFTGGSKHRTLRIFLEKNAEQRAKFAARSAADEEASLPKGVPVETLSFVTHEDCAEFARDFGTVLDVEDLIPGAEYTLEVSSPGLERKLMKPADYTRFINSVIKVQTYTALDNMRHFTGRLTAAEPTATGMTITLDLTAAKQKGKAKNTPTAQSVNLPLTNIEKANLVAEI